MQTNTLRISGSLLTSFVRWYALDMPRRIVRCYCAYASAFIQATGFLFLLRTLFSPWKNIVDRYPARGLNINMILQTFTLNCTARVIGCIIRLFALAMGIAVHIALFAIGVAVLALWILYPLFLLPALWFLVARFFA